jgi:toxin YoeB
MNIIFSKSAFENYVEWEKNNKKIFNKINELIKNISRNPFKGKGKPEALKNELSGFWSRRIDKEHRLVYKVENENLYIIACKYHYK